MTAVLVSPSAPGQDDAGPQDEASRHGCRARPRLQLLALLVTE